MNTRNYTHLLLRFAVAGVVAGAIYWSCNQQQRLADAHESVAGGIVHSPMGTSWRADELAEAGSQSSEELESQPERSGGPFAMVDPSTERCIRNYGPTIKRYAEQYGFDWRLVLAIMKQESRYAHDAESCKGAAGLMQVMPLTGEELARKLDLKDLSNPERNIQAGIYYLRKLCDLFEGAGAADRLKLTLAAYNAGLSRVYDAQELAVYLHDEPTHWQAVKEALPLLAKQFYTLHRSIWGQDMPRSGWFGNSRETIQYVDSVMDAYDAFKLALN